MTVRDRAALARRASEGYQPSLARRANSLRHSARIDTRLRRSPTGYALIVAAAGCLAALSMSRAEDRPVDPLPLRRVQLPADRLEQELARVRQGVLVPLPRAEFEARVRAAATATLGRKNPPRFLQAQYRARLETTALVGSGDWRISSAGPAVLSLEPLNLALQNVKVQKAPGDTAGAILGQLDGKTLGMLLPAAGEHVALFDWSARGNPLPDGIHFELQLPPCSLTTVEINLPDDQALADLQAPCLLAAAPVAEPGGRRLWRIQSAGQSRVSFKVRTDRTRQASATVLLVQQNNEQRLAPGLLQAEYQLELQVLYGGVRELVLECDPSLLPSNVEIDALQDWRLRRDPDPTKPSTLFVRLNEALQPGAPAVLQIRALAPLSGNGPWTSPGVRLRDAANPGQTPVQAVARGETLILRIHPDVQVEDWQPGSFRLATSPARPAARNAEAGQILRLLGGPGVGGKVQRPRARVKSSTLEFRARPLAWWQIGPEQSALTVQISYEVVRGRLFRLPIQVPAGWAVEQVELAPAGLLQQWSLPPERDRTLAVDLQHPLSPGTTARLTLRLRAGPEPITAARPAASLASLPLWPAVATGVAAALGAVAPEAATGARVLAFPEVVPLEARLREGTLAITVDPAYLVAVTGAEAAQTVTEDKGPWAGHPVDLSYPYRGRAPRNRLVVAPRPPRLSARCANKVLLRAGRATVGVRLTVQADAGRPDTIDLHVSAPLSRPWEWKTVPGSPRVQNVQRLDGVEQASVLANLLARPALDAVAALAARPAAGQFWRLRLERPLQRLERIVLETSLEAGEREAPQGAAGQRLWEVPLVRVPGADLMEGLVTLQLAGAGSLQVTTEGLEETSTVRRPELRGSWRVLQYGHAAARLILHGRRAALETASGAAFGPSCLATYVEPDGGLLYRFAFQTTAWQQPVLPLRLPAGARVRAVRVNGHWLAPPVQTALAGDPSAEVVLLPVPSGPRAHNFEVVFGIEGRRWALVTRPDTPPPVLPVREPVPFRRVWYLPPGVEPLETIDLRRLPDPASHTTADPQASPSSALAWWRSWLEAAAASPEASTALRLRLVAASARVRAAASTGREPRLGEALEDLAFELLPEQVSLIIDTGALHEAGVGAATPLPKPATAPPGTPAPLGQELGLAYVPVTSALLLTTQRRLTTWAIEDGGPVPATGSLAEAVATAARVGRDDSGRFRTVVDWLHPTEADAEAVPGPALVPESFGSGWTAWEPVAGGGSPGAPRLVRTAAVSAAGVALAVLFTLAFAMTQLRRRSKPSRAGGSESRRPAARLGRLARALLLADLAAAGLALLWLPPALTPLAWWPGLAGLAVVPWCLFATSARPGARAASPTALDGHPVAVGLLLGLGCLIALPGRAAAPALYTVYVVPGGTTEAPEERVLVPPELIARLDALARSNLALQDAVLLEARYQGSPAFSGDDEKFRFVADYQVQGLHEGAGAVTIPLGGVDLEVAYLDGAPAFPTAVQAPQPGYRIALDRSGAHHVQLQFTVRPTITAEGRELAFTVPPVLQSQLRLSVPDGARYLESLFGRGVQRVGAGGRELTADLGSIQKVAVRWRQEARPGVARLQVKEAYYWDLGAADSRLLAALQYTVRAGATDRLAIALPPGLEVRKVDTNAPAGPVAPPALTTTAVTDSGPARHLELHFQGPLTGGVQVLLELVPRQPPFGPGVSLPLPTPRGATPVESRLAYRLRGLEAAEPKHRGVTFLDPQTFLRQWRASGAEDPGPPHRSYTFQRPVAPVLELDPRPALPHATCKQDISWHLGERQAAVRAGAHLTAPAGDLLIVDWQVPAGVIVTDVIEVGRREGAARVRQWSRGEAGIQVWLDHPVHEATLQLTGWLPRPPGDPVARFELPCLRVASARSPSTFVRLTTAPGLILEPETLHALLAVPDSSPSTWQRTYVTDQDHYGAVFRTRRSPVEIETHVLTFAEVRDRHLVFVAHADFRVRRGELRTAAVRLRNWKGKDVQLDAAHVAQRRVDDRDAASRTWLLELQPGVTGTYRVTLRGSLPAEGLTDLLMPDVSTPGVARQDRWLALARPELQGADPWGLAEVPGPESVPALRPWPGEAERLRRAGGSVWRVQSERWRLRLQPRPAVVGRTPVRIVLVELRAGVLDGRRWVHEACYWLFHEPGTALDLHLPIGARLLAVAVNGAEVAGLQATSGHLWLPLPGGAGVAQVTLRWLLDRSAESLDEPNLEAPRLGRVTALGEEAAPEPEAAQPAYGDVPTLWTVAVPPGYRLRRHGGGAVPIRPGLVALHEAQTQARLSELLVARAQGSGGATFLPQLRTAQERFYRDCRRAEYALSAPDPDAGPGGQDLTVWLKEMKQQNRHRLARFEDLRAKAEHPARVSASDAADAATPFAESDDTEAGPPASARLPLAALPDAGTPAYWLTSGGYPVLEVALRRTTDRPPWGPLANSALVILLLIGLEGRLARSKGSRLGWWRFWPEELAALALLAGAVLGPLVAVGLVLVSVWGRSAALLGWVKGRLHPQSADVRARQGVDAPRSPAG